MIFDDIGRRYYGQCSGCRTFSASHHKARHYYAKGIEFSGQRTPVAPDKPSLLAGQDPIGSVSGDSILVPPIE